jgi:2-keto-4-pentenoate hydratase/2-oxohepta-3-ene-1,7-dioic acid hydratase in catechol pathway
MKIVRFNRGRIGVLHDEKVYDATDAIGLDTSEWPPVGMLRLIRHFDTLRPKLESLLNGPGLPVAETKLEVPILWPNKLVAYPVNYLAHAQEMKSTNRADITGFFLKAASSLSGPQDPIVLPDLPTRDIHHECELAIIIGREGRHISAVDAWDYIFGYACLIDCTVRGKEDRVMRKSYDTFCPIGPSLVTADEVRDASSLDMKLWVNGDLRQAANTRDLILGIPEMISFASAVFTLQPGDIIASGTPGGVGPMRGGDTVKIEIQDVGTMSVSVVQGEGGRNVAICA